MSSLSRLQRDLQKENRARKRWRWFRRFGFGGVFAFVVFGTLVACGVSARFRVHTISLNHLQRSDEARVRSMIEEDLQKKKFFIVPSDTIWFVPKKMIADDLRSAFPAIKSVSIARAFPDDLRITIVEYEGWGVVCRGKTDECYWVDEEGVAFEKAGQFSGLIVPKINDFRARDLRLGERYLEPDLMNVITYFNKAAIPDSNLESVSFTIDAQDQTLRVSTRKGWDILLLASVDPEQAYKNLTLALRTEIKDKIADLDYIDLRFGNKIFYKYKQ